MTIMVEVLLVLGGDLGIVNCVGNDFVAIAASMANRGMWNEILEAPELLAKCGATHAGRVALQLFAAWQHKPKAVTLEQMTLMWCSELPLSDPCHLHSLLAYHGI